MSITLPVPILYTIQQLLADDENVILQRLFDRDQALLDALTTLQNTREDLLVQFGRLDDLTIRIRALNSIIDTIIKSFYLQINPDGIVPDNLTFFKQLIKDLASNINSINMVTAQIVRYQDVQAAIIPVATTLDRLDQLDGLIQAKLAYVFGKWDINPLDDIFSL